jgi:hypothetical protein
MDGRYVYEIRVEGRLGERWSAWFDGFAVCDDGCGGTRLSGPVPDQAALFGLLGKIHALNLTLVSLHRLPPPNEYQP